MRLPALRILLLLLVLQPFPNHVASQQSPDPASDASYLVRVRYTVGNPSQRSVLLFATVPIPPNTTWGQTSYIRSLTPKPTRIYTDSVGNVLADFNLTARPLVPGRVDYEVQIDMTRDLAEKLDATAAGTLFQVPPSVTTEFTRTTYWWNYTELAIPNAIIQLRRQLSGDSGVFNIVHKVRNFTVSNLAYIPLRLRQSASVAYELGHGDNSDYTDVFVTLSRGLSLPANRIWTWMIDDISQGTPVWRGFVMPLVYIPGRRLWVPFDVTFGEGATRPELGEISNRIITFYIEQALPPPDVVERLLIRPDESLYPGGGAFIVSQIVISSQMALTVLPTVRTGAARLFTPTSDLIVNIVAVVLILVILPLGVYYAWKKRQKYREDYESLDKRVDDVLKV